MFSNRTAVGYGSAIQPSAIIIPDRAHQMTDQIQKMQWLQNAEAKNGLQRMASSRYNEQIPDVEPYNYWQTEKDDALALTGRPVALAIGMIFVDIHNFAANEEITPSWTKIIDKVHLCLENADPNTFQYYIGKGIGWQCDRARCRKEKCPQFNSNYKQTLFTRDLMHAHENGMRELIRFRSSNPEYNDYFLLKTNHPINMSDLLLSAIGRLFLLTPRVPRKRNFPKTGEGRRKNFDKFIDDKTLLPGEQQHAADARKNASIFHETRNGIIHTYDKAGSGSLQVCENMLSWYDKCDKQIRTISAESLETVNDAGVASQQTPQIAIHQHHNELLLVRTTKPEDIPPALSAQISIYDPFLGIPPFPGIPNDVFKTNIPTAVEEIIFKMMNYNFEDLAARNEPLRQIEQVYASSREDNNQHPIAYYLAN